MKSAIKAPGIPATFEPVDWNPPGLPTDPDEVMAWLVDPTRRGELYPLYHQLRRVAPVYKNRPEIFHGAWTFTPLRRHRRDVPQRVRRQRSAGRRRGVQQRRRLVHERDAQRDDLAGARATTSGCATWSRRRSRQKAIARGARSPSVSPTSCATASKPTVTPSSSSSTTTSSRST